MQYKRKILPIFLLSLSLLLASAPTYYANRFLFSLDKNETVLTAGQCENLQTPYPELNKIIKKYNVVKIEPWLPNAKETDHDGDVYLNRIYRLTTNQNVEAPFTLLSEIKNVSGSIRGAEQEAVMLTHATPDDPMIGNQWYLVKSQAKEAWNLWDLEAGETPGDRKIVVAVVDDGVEYTHPDLWKNIWINQDEIPALYFALTDTDGDGYITAEEAVNSVGDISGNGEKNLKDIIASNSFLVDGLDNDGDGYIDNIIGWDTNESGGSSDDDKDPMVSNNSHGTHVAGLVGATTDNGVGVASVAYNVSIMPVKATGDETTNSINTGWDGIMYAVYAGADIVNCSWGGPGYSSYAQNLINIAYNTYGSLIVAAAGNGDDDGGPSDEPHYPSGYDHVVSVTAVSPADKFSWANYGEADIANNFYGVDISAPGESMLSTYLTKENSYAYLMGTSMASPMVASCFALLKSVYPDSSNDWLVDRMLTHSDPIDDLNSGYEGQLGTGRVNILKALFFDKWPKLSLSDQLETIVKGDDDPILNPGEDITLLIELKNDPGWTRATNVRGILRSDTEGITIVDSVGTWESIVENSTAINSDNGFTVKFSNDLLPDDYNFKLDLESNTSEGFPYKRTIDVYVTLSLDQEGFPFYANTEVEASPLFVDIDNDGFKEIIFGDKSGDLYVIDHKGDTLAGFPKSLGSQTGGVAVADIDMDDTLEIVATAFDKLIRVYDVYGNEEWSRHTGLFITAIPAIGNIDNDPELEVIVGSYDQKIYAINHDSTDVAGFPYATGQLLHGGVSLADLNADGMDDIVFASKGGQCSIVMTDSTILSGWPINTSGSITSEPQVIVSGENEALILIGNDVGDMYGFDLDGTQRFMIDGSGSIKASPAIYRSGDNIYAFFATSQGYIYKIDLTNNSLDTGWPKQISPVNQSLAIADIIENDNEEAQVLAMGNNGYIYAFDMAGNTVQGFPLNTRYLSKSALAISDIDHDGDNDVIAGNYSGLSVTDLKSIAGKVHWPMHRGTPDRRGSVTTTWTGIKDIDIPQEYEFELIGNAPNPFNPMTIIRYRINDIAPLDLRIYSLDGRLVMHRKITDPILGINEITINMSGYSSGIYLYALNYRNTTQKAKMIYLK